MEYSGLSRSEILELIKQQKAAILQTKIDMEPADNPQAQLLISELKTDLHELLTALQTTAHDRSQHCNNTPQTMSFYCDSSHFGTPQNPSGPSNRAAM